MVSIPGSHYDVFAPGQGVNIATTYNPPSIAPPVPGEFNLEVIINSTGTGNYTIAPGYQGLAIESVPGKVVPPTLTLLHGDYGVVDSGSNDLIILGDGAESVGGAVGDTLAGGTGLNQFLDAHLGNQSVTGGSGGTETIWGGTGDTIRGGSGGNETISGRPGDTIIGGSGGNEFIDGSSGSQSITGGSGGDESIWGGVGDTIRGGSAGNETIGGHTGDTIVGGSGGFEFIDGTTGSQSITGGSGGNESIWGALSDTIHGGTAGNETIGGVAGETIIGGTANTFIDVSGGNASVLAGGGNSTIWSGAHDTVQGLSGGSALIGFAGGNETFWDDGATSGRHDSISTFNQAGGDRVSLNSSTDTIANVVGTASTSGGNTTVTLHDGSTITFIGVSSLNNTFFTTH